jgi:hypothetical protein
MRELRQAVVACVLASGFVLASACGSDPSGGSAGNAGSAGSAGHAGSASGGGGSGAGGRSGAGGSGAVAGTSNGGAGAINAAGASFGAGAPGVAGAGGAAGEANEAAGGSAGTSGIQGGDPTHKLVFVTSVGFKGDFGGVTGADAKCQARADAVKLAGTYKAWLSGSALSSSPSVRFTHAAVPYVLLDGSVVANDWADLTDGTLQHAINLSEVHTKLSFFAFTFTLADGTPGLAGSASQTCYQGNNCTCDDWTNGETQGSPTPGSAVGQTYGTDKQWTDYSFLNGCGDTGISLYCFEQ